MTIKNLLLFAPAAMSKIEALLLSLVGLALVIVVLFALMWVIKLMSACFSAKKAEETSAVAKEKPVVAEKVAVINKPSTAPVGQLTLIRTSERDAALIMAIVADGLDVPLNQLRFLSIKQVGEDK